MKKIAIGPTQCSIPSDVYLNLKLHCDTIEDYCNGALGINCLAQHLILYYEL